MHEQIPTFHSKFSREWSEILNQTIFTSYLSQVVRESSVIDRVQALNVAVHIPGQCLLANCNATFLPALSLTVVKLGMGWVYFGAVSRWSENRV